MRDRASAGGAARSLLPDSTSRPLSSSGMHCHIRRRRNPPVIQYYGRAADHDTHAGPAVAESVLDRRINSRRGDCERQTDQGAAPPSPHDLLAILIGGGIVRSEEHTSELQSPYVIS